MAFSLITWIPCWTSSGQDQLGYKACTQANIKSCLLESRHRCLQAAIATTIQSARQKKGSLLLEEIVCHTCGHCVCKKRTRQTVVSHPYMYLCWKCVLSHEVIIGRAPDCIGTLYSTGVTAVHYTCITTTTKYTKEVTVDYQTDTHHYYQIEKGRNWQSTVGKCTSFSLNGTSTIIASTFISGNSRSIRHAFAPQIP